MAARQIGVEVLDAVHHVRAWAGRMSAAPVLITTQVLPGEARRPVLLAIDALVRQAQPLKLFGGGLWVRH